MAATPSKMLALGSVAPAFSLRDVVTNQLIDRDAVRGERGLLVMFICAHCPYVKHVQAELAQIGRDYAGSGVGIVAITSNDAGQYPEDGPEGSARQASAVGFTFPYLYDETQDIARAYDAACTPDFFLYDQELKLVYRGQLDDSRPNGQVPVTGRDLRAALDAMTQGRPAAADQRPSVGCNIKWK